MKPKPQPEHHKPTDFLREILPAERISLSQLARELDLNMSTVYRWTIKGCRGVRLETIQIGGRFYTWRAALEGFLSQTVRRSQPMPTPAAISRERRTAIKHAEDELHKMGVYRPGESPREKRLAEKKAWEEAEKLGIVRPKPKR